jgi:Ion channel
MGTTTRFGFPILFLCLAMLLVLPPYLTAMGLSAVTGWLLSAILLSSLYLVARNPRQLIVGMVLAVPTLGLTMSQGFLQSTISIYIHYLLYIIFFIYIELFLTRYFLAKPRVTVDMIFAAMCAYIILGLIWMFIYALVETRMPGSFVTAHNGDGPIELFQFTYFSFVTITTLGYGDVTPVTEFSKSWAILEAILGQFYLAVVLARLVGLYTATEKQ